MNMNHQDLLDLFMIMILNNLFSMYIYEISQRTIKTPLIIKIIWYLSAFITSIIGLIFFIEFIKYFKSLIP